MIAYASFYVPQEPASKMALPEAIGVGVAIGIGIEKGQEEPIPIPTPNASIRAALNFHALVCAPAHEKLFRNSINCLRIS
jgi:hypothetical protein